MKRFEHNVFLSEFAARWDVLAFVVVIGLIVFLGESSRGLLAPLSQLSAIPLSLDPAHLPEYAARTTFRMLAALLSSLILSFYLPSGGPHRQRARDLPVPLPQILPSVASFWL